MSNVKLIKTGGILDQMVAGTAKKEDLTLPYDRSTQIRSRPIGAKNMSSTFQLPKIQQQNTLSNKLNFQQRLPQPKITPLMAQIGGASVEPPMTELMYNVSKQVPAKQEKIVLGENPTAWERLGLTARGAGQQYAGSTLNALSTMKDFGVSNNIWTEEQGLADVAEQAQKAAAERSLAKTTDPAKSAKLKTILDGISTKPSTEAILNTPDPIRDAGHSLMTKGGESTARAKEGASWLGKLGIDVGTGAIQLAADIGLGALTGGGALIPMAVRSFGGAAQEAEDSGASINQQVGYGGLSAATSVLVEKISNAGKILSKAFGKGIADDVLEKGMNKAIGKLVKNEAVSGRLAAALSAGAGEGAEEMIESALSPIYQKLTYNPDAKYDADTISDILYDGLVGSIIGGFAGGLGGGNVQTQAQDVAQTPPTIAPALQDIAPQPAQAPTSAQNSLKVKLPTETQNAAGGIVEPVADNKPALRVKPVQVEQPAIFPENSLGAKITQKLPQGTGAASPEFAYQERANQQHSTDTAFTEAERQMQGLRTEDSTHQVVTDKNAMAQAEQRLAFDFEGEKADLATKQDWDKADTTTAHLILRKLTGDARKSGDYSEVIKWNKTLEKQKSAQGQALQANRQFANKPESIVADAAESLFSDKVKNISEAKKTELMEKISSSAEALDNVQPGDTASVIAMIKDLSKQRKTDGIFNKEMSGAMSSVLDYVANQKWGFDFLKEIAAGQVRSIATDYNKVGFWSGVKSIRFSNMLSSIATVMRNLGGNQAFDLGDSVSNNVAIPFDMLLSKLSGNRSVAFDASWFSDAKRRGSVDGFLKSFIQVGLDIDIDNVQSKYETTPGRTFKMTGNAIERFLSTVQKWQGYALQSTDEFAKGGTQAEAQRGIDKLKRRGKTDKNALQDRATEIAKQRTFQNAGKAAQAVLGIRSSMNTFSATDSQGGKFGLGDLVVPFAQVPANLAEQAVNATPAGLAKSIVQFADAIGKAKQGKLTPDQQANIVTNLGRGLTGTAGFAFFAGLAIKGILKVVGSDDKDKDALERAEGRSGTQLNLDALSRWAKGESAEWQSGDTLVNMGFLEHLNVQMAGGALIAEAYKEDEKTSFGDIAKASIQSVFQTVLELPAIAQISELIDGYRYSKAEDVSGKLADAAGSYMGSQASSFIVPNLVAGVARGLDNKVRDTHTSESVFKQTRDDIFSKIPKLREALPVKLDPWGEERTTGDSGLLNFINSTVLPARVNQYQTSEINKELFRLDAADVNVKFPSRKMVSKLSFDNVDYDLDQKAQEAFHNQSHQLAQQYMGAAIKDSEYKAMSDGEKAKLLSDMQGFAIDTAKREYFTSRGIEYKSDYDKAFEAQQAGMKPSTYYHYKNALKKERPEGGTPSQLQFSKAINTLNISDKQKGKLWDIQNGEPSDKNPFTGLLAQEGLPAQKTIEIMEAFKTIESDMKSYEKADGGPGKSHVQAAYFRQWLYDAGYNAAQVSYIEEVFTTWQMIPVEKPSKKALGYVAANPR